VKYNSFIEIVIYLRFRKFYRKSGGVLAKDGENSSSEPVKNTSYDHIQSIPTPIINKVSE